MRQAIRFLMEQAAKSEPAFYDGVLSVVLTDDAGIARVNQCHLNHTGPTDVISFRLDPLPGENVCTCSGEIFVNVEMAVRWVHRWHEAHLRRGRGSASTASRTWDADQELALYLAHGCDHLTGATDSDPLGRRRMRRREMAWLRRAGAIRILH
jgi:ssRNA-specific RNase YbeY (16S rRNA maturation enzyme)